MADIVDVKNYPLHIWVIIAGIVLLPFQFDLGIVVIVTGVFTWVYNHKKTDKKKKKFNKNSFKMNSSTVTRNGKSLSSKNTKRKDH